MTNRLAMALNDLAVTFDGAIRKAGTPRLARALCNLRAEAEDKLRRAAGGYGQRSPAEIMSEVLDRVADLVGDRSVTALAKRASGAAHIVVGDQQIAAAALPRFQPAGEELIAALAAIGKEFRELAASIERVAKKYRAEARSSSWHAYHRQNLLDMLQRRDVAGAERELSRARQSAHVLLDAIQVEASIAE